MRQINRSAVILSALVLVLSVTLLGCPKQPEVSPAGPAAVGPAPVPTPPQAAAPTPPPAETPVTRPTPPTETPIPPAPGAAAAGVAAATAPLKDIFFDFDTSNIREDQRTALIDNVTWLKANPNVKITIEGHCDERGTVEYNLGLGERRAKAVKDYLAAAGIPAGRVGTITYGKERPFVLGHDESAWKWNRRGHFVVAAQ